MLIDPDICLKKKRTNLAKLQSLSSYQLRKTRGKIFPCSLLLRECMLLLFYSILINYNIFTEQFFVLMSQQ